MEQVKEGSKWEFMVLIDRIDDTWDGSDKAVIILMALMHACVELAASTKFYVHFSSCGRTSLSECGRSTTSSLVWKHASYRSIGLKNSSLN